MILRSGITLKRSQIKLPGKNLAYKQVGNFCHPLANAFHFHFQFI